MHEERTLRFVSFGLRFACPTPFWRVLCVHLLSQPDLHHPVSLQQFVPHPRISSLLNRDTQRDLFPLRPLESVFGSCRNVEPDDISRKRGDGCNANAPGSESEFFLHQNIPPVAGGIYPRRAIPKVIISNRDGIPLCDDPELDVIEPVKPPVCQPVDLNENIHRRRGAEFERQ